METRRNLYKPISTSEFRVVHLLPGAFNDEIRCVLQTRSRGVKTCYEALSYQWGDESIIKPISIAHLDSSPGQETPVSRITAWPESLARKAVTSLRAVAERYHIHVAIRLLSWSICTYLIWSFLSPLPLNPSPWISCLIPRDVYMVLFSMVCGSAPLDIGERACKLGVEVARTKPWTLAYNFRLTGSERLEFEILQVPTNLALALQHLRRETHSRTLWIDALCINQANEDEKRMQIQRMDWVYANASPIVVWLGGYHGIMVASNCEEGSDCLHRRQIQAAFDLFRSRSGWRLLAPFYFKRDKEDRNREALAGLWDIYKRGWWERLWVIQEVALATGPVRLQCGHNTCDFDKFRSAQHAILWDHRDVKEMGDDSKPVERLIATVKDFRHSAFHDLEGPLPKLLYSGISKISDSFGQDIHNKQVLFHQQPFAGRLQRVLLKTAGQFQCRDDRDRLYAVLGIAGGAESGHVTKTADFVRYMSSFLTSMVLSHAIDTLLKASPSLPFKIAAFAIGFAHSSWAVFYDSNAKHWTISRPEYVVTGYREVIDAVAGKPGESPSRAEFFTALARYLANKTKTLAFLDAATCGEDKEAAMPSWVPNWTREVGSPAYDFSIRVKKDQASDRFGFAEDGKALWIMGQRKGTVHVVRSVADSTVSQPWPFQDLFEKWLSLPIEAKEAAAAALELIQETLREEADAGLEEAMKKQLVSLSSRLIKTLLDLGGTLLREGGTTLVYSFDAKAKEMGFLKAGEAAKGDRIVFVPGCFHHLVLRRQGQATTTGNRWKLVGLVAMGTSLSEPSGCSKSEWAQLREDGALFKYTIV